VGDFSIAAAEVSYQLWYTVRTWAIHADRGADKYTFANEGKEAGIGTVGALPTEEKKYCPVGSVSWTGAVVWCNAYSEWAAANDPDKTDYRPLYKKSAGQVIRSYSTDVVLATDEPGYRLPTRAEWEFAARGGRPRAAAWQYTYAGSDELDVVGWYTGNSGNAIHQIADKAPNTLGIYDMTGNVGEFVADSIAAKTGHIMGGDFRNQAASCTVVSRFISSGATNYSSFRVAGPYEP
jgi:formylglycine-generating enzyme required for sulfatase activity